MCRCDCEGDSGARKSNLRRCCGRSPGTTHPLTSARPVAESKRRAGLHCAPPPNRSVEPMPDALGPRLKFGVIAPASNTILQPEYDAMRPPGITNQMARVLIPDTPVGTETEFATMMGQVRASIETALDTI